jgi:hypothetical protein
MFLDCEDLPRHRIDERGMEDRLVIVRVDEADTDDPDAEVAVELHHRRVRAPSATTEKPGRQTFVGQSDIDGFERREKTFGVAADHPAVETDFDRLAVLATHESPPLETRHDLHGYVVRRRAEAAVGITGPDVFAGDAVSRLHSSPSRFGEIRALRIAMQERIWTMDGEADGSIANLAPQQFSIPGEVRGWPRGAVTPRRRRRR